MKGNLRTAGGRLVPAPRLLLAGLTIVTAILAGILIAGAADAATGWRACLSCHAAPGLTLTTAKGESMSLTVAAAELAASPHGNLECRGCHAGIRLDRHPSAPAVQSLRDYRVSASKSCLGCHSEERLRAKPIHAPVAVADGAIACVECHGSHGVRAVAAWKESAAINDYCLGCHGRAGTVKLPSGGTFSIAVSAQELKASVHPDHACTDCHAEFSKTAHATVAPRDRKERSLAAARMCARCHAEKMKQIEGSVHFALLRSGVAGAPGCTDCHSAHAVAPKERYATLAGTPCRQCHGEVFAAYSESMHGKARLGGGHLDAPFCSECHRAHDVSGSASPEKIRASCLGCHPTAEAKHAVWLPNAKLHLEGVSCASCHAPAAKRVVALRIVEEGSGRAIGEREVASLLGGDAATAIDPNGGGVDAAQLWSLLRRLESRRSSGAAALDFTGRLELARGLDAHRLADKSQAVRNCESCHQSGAACFSQVAVKLARDDGRAVRYPGAPGLLVSAASVMPVNKFYALGGTRLVVLDWLLVLAFLAGCAVPVGHFTLRYAARRLLKGGK